MGINLELKAMHWLKHERGCVIVLCERSPREWLCGRPDVLGVMPSRYAYEVEIKRTLSDFRADQDKRSRRLRGQHPEKFPKEFYYLVPEGLPVLAELPDWAGLLVADSLGYFYPTVIKPAPINRLSERYSLKECAKLVSLQSNQIVATEAKCESLRAVRDESYTPYYVNRPGYTDFQI